MGEIYYRDRNEGKFDKNGKKKKPNWQYRFELCTVDGKRQRKEKSGFKRKQDAVAAATLAYAEYLGGGEVIEPSRMSFSDVLDSWMEEYCRQELADETIKNYEKRIRNHIKPALGQYAVSSLSTHVIQRFINEMAKAQYSRNTISSVKGIISKALKYAKRMENGRVCSRMRSPSCWCTRKIPRRQRTSRRMANRRSGSWRRRIRA